MIDYLLHGTSLLNNVIQGEPGAIVGPITRFLGYILNGAFEFAWIFSPSGAHTLGISIILLTIITRILLLPLALKQQKSMVATQRLMPEIAKIKEKYGNSKDKEIQRKVAMETQALYAKHKINPFAGCLPALIQLPIFFALNFMIRQAYMFINRIDYIYTQIATVLLDMPDEAGFLSGYFLREIASPKVPADMMPFNFAVVENFQKIIHIMSPAEWDVVLHNVCGTTLVALESLLVQKNSIDHFLGINLIELSGLRFPGIIIPILAVVTTFASSYLMMKATPKSTDPNQQMMQKLMIYMMPLMMGYFTVTFAAGVGIYWITISVIQVVQQFFVNKYYKPKLEAQLNDKIVSVQ